MIYGDPKSHPSLLSCQVVQTIEKFSLIRIFPISSAQVDAFSSREWEPNYQPNDESSVLGPVIVDTLVRSAARMLNKQWPHSGQAAAAAPADISTTTDEADSDDSGMVYYRNLIVHHNPTASAQYGLACSYVLVRHAGGQACLSTLVDSKTTTNQQHDFFYSRDCAAGDGDVLPQSVGHGRLTECFESAGGDAAAATFVIIDEDHRGNGYGKILMTLLEEEAKRLGYHFVYLWTRTAVDFYTQHCGYRQCNRVSLRRQCLRSLEVHQVQNLEAVLMQQRQKRLQQLGGNVHHKDETDSGQQQHPRVCQDGSLISHAIGHGRPMKKLETILLPPDNNSNNDGSTGQVQNDDVWLRKRLVENVRSVLISSEDRWKEIENFVATMSPTLIPASCQWYYRWNPTVPWQSQIGPSCGLVALRMVREYYHQLDNDSPTVSAQNGGSSDGNDKNMHEQAIRQNSSSSTDDNKLNETSENGNIQFPSLLQHAQEKGYTHDGEIFDATHLTDLAVNVCDMANARCRTVVAALMTANDIDSVIRDGGLWILPYDSNPRTKLPTKQLGKHAHWGIIVGILVCCCIKQPEGGSVVEQLTGEHDDVLGQLLSSSLKRNESKIHHPAKRLPGTATALLPLQELVGGTSQQQYLANDAKCHTFLCVQHSLSSQWAIAPIDEWMESNQQLVSVDDDRFKHTMKSNLNLKNQIIRITIEPETAGADNNIVGQDQ